MDDLKEVSYKCSVDESHPTWGGIEGEIPTVCPECEGEGEIVNIDDEGAGDETEEAPIEEVEVETAKYVITGLVDFLDEYGNVAGQFPIGSEQELPVSVGDKAVESGNATRVE